MSTEKYGFRPSSSDVDIGTTNALKVSISEKMSGSYSVSLQIEGDIMQIHHKYTLLSLFLCAHALICVCGTFIFSPILLSMNCHSDGRSAGNRRPYPDVFQRSINLPD